MLLLKEAVFHYCETAHYDMTPRRRRTGPSRTSPGKVCHASSMTRSPGYGRRSSTWAAEGTQ
eukprot:5026141-Lingulodinium_polyedra.AAC.1